MSSNKLNEAQKNIKDEVKKCLKFLHEHYQTPNEISKEAIDHVRKLTITSHNEYYINFVLANVKFG